MKVVMAVSISLVCLEPTPMSFSFVLTFFSWRFYLLSLMSLMYLLMLNSVIFKAHLDALTWSFKFNRYNSYNIGLSGSIVSGWSCFLSWQPASPSVRLMP